MTPMTSYETRLSEPSIAWPSFPLRYTKVRFTSYKSPQIARGRTVADVLVFWDRPSKKIYIVKTEYRFSKNRFRWCRSFLQSGDWRLQISEWNKYTVAPRPKFQSRDVQPNPFTGCARTVDSSSPSLHRRPEQNSISFLQTDSVLVDSR